MTRLFLLLVALLALFGPSTVRAASPYVELRPGLCSTITKAEIAAPVADRQGFRCGVTPSGYHDRWLWQQVAVPPSAQNFGGPWVLLIDQPRFRTIVATVRYDDGSLFQDRINADAVGDHWAIGGYLQFVVPKRDVKPVTITIGFERLAAWELIRKVRAVSVTGYIDIARSWLLLMGIIAGTIASGLVYSLFLVAGLRYSYLSHYALWTLAVLIHTLFWSNVIFLWMPQLAGPWGVRINLWSAGAAMFFSLSFFVAFFEKGLLPKAFLRFQIGLGLLIVVTAFFGSFESLTPAHRATQMFDLLMMTAVISCLAGTLVAIRRGSRAGLFYLAAWTLPILALILRVSRNFGLIDHMEIVDQAVFIAAAIQVLMLAIALADRFVRFRRERDSAAAEREQLRTLSETDQLTGLYNRRGFIARIQTMLAPGDVVVGLILLDLDLFKSINDTHGHDVGDLVLMRLGRTMLQCLQSSDIAGRMGGEEFAIASPGADRGTLKILAERIRREVAACRLDDLMGEGARVTVSIGIVNSRSEPGGFEKLYRAADQALYAAKRDGRNRVSLFLPDISAVEWANPAKRA